MPNDNESTERNDEVDFGFFWLTFYKCLGSNHSCCILSFKV